MDIEHQLLQLNPLLPKAELRRWIPAGREYADRWPLLPAHDRESVAFLFSAYGLAAQNCDRMRIRIAIDVLLRPFYPGVDRHVRVY